MNKKITISSKLAEPVARWFLAAIFIVAGALKIGHADQMLSAIEGFRAVDSYWAVFGAYFFPWMELWAGVGLLWLPTRRAAALVIVGLMALFIAMLIQAWARGIELNCGCFGFYPETGPDDYSTLLIRDFGLLVLGACVFLFSGREKTAKVEA